MTRVLSIVLLVVGPAVGVAQPRVPAALGQYRVTGERHGPGFFPRVRYPEVEYEIGDTLRFDHYHTVEVMYGWLERWAKQYPDLVTVSEVARSLEGRPILQATVTNRRTGSHLDKPAALFEGGRHSGEITGSESVLWLLQHLLQGYGRNPRITHLLDTRTIYLRPQNNPDGSNLFLHTAQRNRSNLRPSDNDRDGLLDEDPEDDLDGDGVAYSMRWRVPAGTGNAVQDRRDPTGRLMRFQSGGDWRVATEGIDNDGDGRLNEDGIGGLDLHRNYPVNWRPEPGADSTGRGYTEDGAGAYPLSEPETRAIVLWLLSHPHVSVVNSMDTPIGIHLRPPSTSGSAERMYPEDLALYQRFDSLGMSITGYPAAGDVYLTANRFLQTMRGETGQEPFRPVPTFGHGPDFGYFGYGAIWYGDELWARGYHEDVNGDGIRDDLDALLWDDRENRGRGFRAWTAVQHPTLGTVELGGFHPKFFTMNPPTGQLVEWAGKQAFFNLELANQLPLLELLGVEARRVSPTRADTAEYDVTVRWTNRGGLPTALRQARLVKIVREDQIHLEITSPAGEPVRSVRITSPAGRDKVVYSGWTEPAETKVARFTVRAPAGLPLVVTAHLRSTRGGALRRTIAVP